VPRVLKDKWLILKDKWLIAVIVGVVIFIVVISIVIPGISTTDRAAVVAAIVDVVLLIITVWLAYLTKKNVNAAADSVSATKKVVSATNKLIELQTEPFVYIGARWERKVIPLSPSMAGFKPPPFDLSFELLVFIQNRGSGPARNIKVVDVKDDFPIDGNYDFPAGNFFVNGELRSLQFKETPVGKGEMIKEMAPGQEMIIARVHDRLASGAVSGLEYSVTVVFTYENSLGKSKRGSGVLDFPSYRNSPSPL
jgi:hypothetical protein